MSATALICEASKNDSKSISILVDRRYIVYVHGSLAEKFLTQFHKYGQFKFQYFGKKKTVNGFEFHDVEFYDPRIVLPIKS